MPSFRPATGVDEPFLLGLTVRLADFPLPAWRTADEIARADHAILLDALRRPTPQSLILIAEEPAGAPAGYVFARTASDYFTGHPHAHVEVLAVAPGSERTGLGRALLDQVEEWAGRQGYGQVTLNVFARNERARQVYQHLGYEPETVHYRKAVRRRDDPAPGSG